MSSMKPICWTKWPASCCHFQTLARAKVYDELAASKWIQIALNLVYPKLYWFLIRCFPLQVCHSMPMYSPCWTSSSNPKFAPCSSRHIMRIILFGFGMFWVWFTSGHQAPGSWPIPIPIDWSILCGQRTKKGDRRKPPMLGLCIIVMVRQKYPKKLSSCLVIAEEMD
jgi:hypothetical protein